MRSTAYAEPTLRRSLRDGERGPKFRNDPGEVDPSVSDDAFAGSDASSSADLPPQALDAARREIDRLVQEIAESAATSHSAGEFFASFVERSVRAIAAEGGILWEKRDGRWHILARQGAAAQAIVGDKQSLARHAELLDSLDASSPSRSLLPHAGDAKGATLNPTPHLMLLARIDAPGGSQKVLEALQRPVGGPVSHRNYLRFLERLAAYAADFCRRQERQTLADRRQDLERIETFLRAIHSSLEIEPTADAIVNEGRTFLNADRVSLALCSRRSCQIIAISGVDQIHRRAGEVRRLESLAAATLRQGETFTYDGAQQGDAAEYLPPQIEKRLAPHLDQSQTRSLAIVPLFKNQKQDVPNKRRRPVACLIVEFAQGHPWSDGERARLDRTAGHIQDAINASLAYSRIPALPVWKAMVAVSSLFGMKRLPWVALAAATIGGAGYWLATTPGDLDMACEGKVRPSIRRHVFAPADGKVSRLLVTAEQPVAAGQPLAQLASPDLEVEIVELLGEQRALEERRSAVGRTLLDQGLTRAEKTKAGGELEQIEEQRRTVATKLELKRQQEAELLVTAPVAGVVATWQLEDLLLRRPVQKGQRLLTVQDPSGDWELELFLPEKRFRFVREAWETAQKEGRPTEVEFILASHPETELKGTIVAIEPHADVFDPEAGNCVRMRAAIDKRQLPDLRDGSLVSARVKCGEASLAYVLSQEALDTVQAKVAFYLPW